MSTPAQTLQWTGVDGRGLRIVFTKLGDRIGHEVVLLDNGESRTVLRTIEGDDTETWPPSPPFQDLLIQPIRPGVTAAMLVGMAGQSHWSASIEVDQAAGQICFDIACRIKQRPCWLGSSYAIFSTREFGLDGDSRAFLDHLAVAVDQHTARLDGSDEGEVATLSITPVESCSDGVPTRRWKYWLRRINARRA